MTGNTSIKKDCVIGPNSIINDSEIGEGSTIQFSVVDEAEIKSNGKIGPYAHLRKGSILDENVKVGAFAETKNSTIGKGSKVPHLAYVGDAELEEDVNFQEGVTKVARKEILNSFNETFKGFEKLKIVDHTACFRPYSENNTPIIRKSRKYSNLFYGTGAGRNGIKLGPVMGRNIYKKIFY